MMPSSPTGDPTSRPAFAPARGVVRSIAALVAVASVGALDLVGAASASTMPAPSQDLRAVAGRSPGRAIAAAATPGRSAAEPAPVPPPTRPDDPLPLANPGANPGQSPAANPAANQTNPSATASTDHAGHWWSDRAPTAAVSPTTQLTATSAFAKLWGTTRSGLPWGSGIWWGGRWTPSDVDAYGTWRGRPLDFQTVYSGTQTWAEMDDTWSITHTARADQARLNYGLVLLPIEAAGDFAAVTSGAHDATFQRIAHTLVQTGHSDAWVRLGWEHNLRDWPWGTTADNVDAFRAAWRHAATVLKQEAPGLKLEFGIACGAPLAGDTDRMASLTRGYPGDDLVDIVGCDTYDWFHTTATSDSSWQSFLRPGPGAGLGDVVDFARAHGKAAAVGEWGLAATHARGSGDNPFVIAKMYDYFAANADVIAAECYFDEPQTELKNSLIEGNMPAAAVEYRGQLAAKASGSHNAAGVGTASATKLAS